MAPGKAGAVVLLVHNVRLLCAARRPLARGAPGVDFAQTLEYLALCKFERKETDSIAGRITMLWLTVADMVDSDLDDATVDEALAAWETESARLRAEAVRAARAERS